MTHSKLKPTDKYFQYSCCPRFRDGYCKDSDSIKCSFQYGENNEKCSYYEDSADKE